MDIMRKYGKLLGVAISALLLAVIFVPFQQATAFTVSIDLPDDPDDTIPQSAAGENFEIVIDVETAEFISVEEITLIRDNNLASVAQTIFDSAGEYDSGSPSMVINNELTISAFSDSGYAYGYGIVSNGATGPTGYSFSIPSSSDFISGNTGGASNPIGASVVGLLGPGEITISGKLRTSDLADGAHTLDVLINTGSGVNPDELTTSTFSFTIEEDDSIITTEESIPANVTSIDISTTDSDGDPIDIELDLGTATNITGTVVVTVQNVDDFIAANTEEQLEDQGFELSGNNLEFVTDDDDTTFIAAGFIIDIDLSSLGLPDGTEVTLSMDYDDSGLSSGEENRLRLMHQLDSLTEWEALTNDDDTINDGDEVDTTANVVYGTTHDFSLFGPAVREENDSDDDDDDNDRRSNNNRDGPREVVVITWPPSSVPSDGLLDRILVGSSAFLNAQGLEIDEAETGQQLSIAGEFTNNQDEEQDYAFIVQVVNEDDEVTDISWQQGTLASGSTAEITTLWTPEDDGDYTIQIFVWDGIGSTPEPLSEVTVKNIEVQ